jgi:2-desacetyl-2-hydroxyethyl bacteriochlorophyllide A dehydrogenase
VKAAVKTGPGPGRLEVRGLPDPVPGPGEALVAIRYAGLCHTDVSMVDWNAAARDGYRPGFPLVLGHEYTGTVVVSDQAGPPPGTRVAGSAHVTCGQCRFCSAGSSMLCARLAVLGLDVAGVFAELAALPVRNLVAVPDTVPDEVAVLAEPYAVAAHAVRTAAVRPGERVAIVGPGAVGLCATAAARFAGAGEIAVFGTGADAAQLRMATRLGAGSTSDRAPSDGDFDVVVETAGHPAAVATSLRICRPGGRVVTVGLPAESLTLDTAELARREQRLIGVRAYDLAEWADVPCQLDAAPELRELVTHTVGLGDLARAAELLATRQATKVVVSPAAG